MKRKLVKNGRGTIMNIPTGILENIGAAAGDDVEITFNINTKKAEFSKIKHLK